ncbi:hypothetical protein CON39_11790 [Bacillus thuringiensis]|uniref:hypothetical protein n=1 Tax=Bacillus thuringiensis TaxID=1428 RepID=UPI000BEDDF6C|nr:hypothetical protein [Bacillus thuringiensis]PEF30347.1 hypothetical protein CON39_11790 [Bacillus thuringiensis]
MSKSMSFKELMEKHPPKCKKCEVVLKGFASMKRLVDVDGQKPRGLYCLSCWEEAQTELFESRYVETYKDIRICHKDGRFYTAWNTALCFPTLTDCRTRIDLGDLSLIEIILQAKAKREDGEQLCLKI